MTVNVIFIALHRKMLLACCWHAILDVALECGQIFSETNVWVVQVHAMLERAEAGLAADCAPEPAPEGMGGTYFLRDESRNRVCIFKPCDEEPMAPNNPKEWQGRAMGAPGLKPSVRVGEAAIREVAAYLLDHHGFAGVPAACLAKCYHPVLNYKVCIVQSWVIAIGWIGNGLCGP
jgi:hypothetical protein